jgi:hypothetical protein
MQAMTERLIGIGQRLREGAITDQLNPINATIHKPIRGLIIVNRLVPRLSKRQEYADGALFGVYGLDSSSLD